MSSRAKWGISIVPALLVVLMAASSGQRSGHPFIASRIIASVDSFVIVTHVTKDSWRPIGGLVQTLARDTNAIRLAVDYEFPDSKQRVEMAMDLRSLAPLLHWEQLSRRGQGDTQGEVMFRDGRAKGAFILSKTLIDIPIDTGIVDDDASTALLPSLPLDSVKSYAFRTFASPGLVQTTRVEVQGIDTVTVPIGRVPAFRLLVMSRDTSQVYVSSTQPRRVVLVRLTDGSQEMRVINRR